SPAGRGAYVPAGRERRPLALGDPAAFAVPRPLDVLVPTCDRPAELTAVLAAQAGAPEFGVVVGVQSAGGFSGEPLDLAPGEWRAYRVAWIGACVLFDRAALVAAGGFDFWAGLPA